jgi:REP element-mobilizing transposase RayT
MRREIEQRRRRTIRLRGYDYTDQGPYFLTITTQHRESIFRDIIDGNMGLNEAGRIVHDEWLRSAEIRPEFWFDAFVVMPNHIHTIVAVATPGSDARSRSLIPDDGVMRRPAHSLGSFVGGFKAATTRRIT